MSMLFLLGTRRQAIKSTAVKGRRRKPPPSGYFNGLIYLYKWAFNYNVGPPAAPAGATAVGEEPPTRISTPPALLAATMVGVEPCTRAATLPATEPLRQQALCAPTITGTPAILIPAVTPHLLPPVPTLTSALPLAASPLPAPAQPGPSQSVPNRPYGPQAIIDIIGDGIDTALRGMADGFIFIFEGIIIIFKRIFRIDR